jgi:hypothetical protein
MSRRCYAQRIDITKNVKYLAAAGENWFSMTTIQPDLVLAVLWRITIAQFIFFTKITTCHFVAVFVDLAAGKMASC